METDYGEAQSNRQRETVIVLKTKTFLTPQRRTEYWEGDELLDKRERPLAKTGQLVNRAGCLIQDTHETMIPSVCQHLVWLDQPQNKFSLVDESRGGTCTLLSTLSSFPNRPALCRQARCLGSCIPKMTEPQTEGIQVPVSPFGGDLVRARQMILVLDTTHLDLFCDSGFTSTN